MKEFFWTSGHLGWGFFTLVVFTGLWWLFADLVWRLKSIRIARLGVAILIGWAIGAGLILLGFHLDSR